jgi:hypothetical protein
MLGANAGDQLIPEALMIALAVVVDHVLCKRTTKVPLTERNEPVQALFLDRADKPFGVRVAVRRAKRCLNHLHTGILKQLPDGEAPLPVAVAEEHPVSAQQALIRNCQMTYDLEHERFIRMRCGARDLDAARVQFNHKDRVERGQPARGPNFRREEVCGDDGAPVGS